MSRVGATVLLCALLAACGRDNETRIGEIVLDSPWLRATAPGASVGGGYVSVRNTGTAHDRLVEVSGSVANRVEIHQMLAVDGVMRMRPVTDGLPIPAGAAVALEPGGYHLMLLGLERPLVEGERHTLRFRFEQSGEVDVPFQVRAADAAGHGHAHH